MKNVKHLQCIRCGKTYPADPGIYTCTECGRCTSVCPANITGKKLSPRKIMMDTRDRLEEVGKNIDQHGADHDDGKSLLGNYITEEELWACTTCNACTEACPVNIDKKRKPVEFFSRKISAELFLTCNLPSLLIK